MLKIALYFLSFIFVINSYGQDPRPDGKRMVSFPKRFISKVEFLVGPSMAFFRGDVFYKEHDVLKIEYSANIALIHEFNPRFQLSSVFSYEKKGSKVISYSLNEDYNPPAITKHISNVTLNYITVSLLPQYSFLKNRRLFIGAGPYFGYLRDTKYTSKLYINGSLLIQSGGRPDPNDANKKYDSGLAMMAGFNVLLKERQVGSIQLMYKKGMMDINQPMLSQTRTNSLSILFAIQIK